MRAVLVSCRGETPVMRPIRSKGDAPSAVRLNQVGKTGSAKTEAAGSGFRDWRAPLQLADVVEARGLLDR
jgi:hypothetical protein